MTSSAVDSDAHEAAALRVAMVDEVVRRWATVVITISDPVLAALRAVPRHIFAPDVDVARAYADDIVAMKRDPAGTVLSSVSAPNMIALMLDQLDLQPGHRVLEIGSGGYQAAVIADMVGPHGSVTSVDIDPDVIARARHALDQTAYTAVVTHCGDGEYGHPATAPFDRIIVSVEAVDLAPAWRTQLAPGGRLTRRSEWPGLADESSPVS